MLTLSGSWSLRRTRRQTPGRNGSDTFMQAFPIVVGKCDPASDFLLVILASVCCVSLVWSTGSAVWTWMETGCSACTSWSSSTRSSVRSWRPWLSSPFPLRTASAKCLTSSSLRLKVRSQHPETHIWASVFFLTCADSRVNNDPRGGDWIGRVDSECLLAALGLIHSTPHFPLTQPFSDLPTAKRSFCQPVALLVLKETVTPIYSSLSTSFQKRFLHATQPEALVTWPNSECVDLN